MVVTEPLPQHVIFLTDNLERPNGIVSSVCLLAEEFSRRGCMVELWTFRTCDEEIRQSFSVFDALPGYRATTYLPGFATSRQGLRPIRRAVTFMWWPLVAHRMRRAAERWDPHALVIGAGLDAVHTAWLAGVRPPGLVSQVHLSISSLDLLQRRNIRGASVVSRVVTALTEQDAAGLSAQGLNAVCLPNPVPPTPSTASPGNSRTVVFVGRLAPEKQVAHLVRAFDRVADESWTLDIYGAGPEESALRRLIKESSRSIRLRGTTHEVSSIFEHAAIHVLPSLAEGLPMSVLEAAAAGVPTLAYPASPGTIEAVGEGGIIVPQDDEDALASGLRRLMNSPALRESLGQQARAHAHNYAPDIIVDRWIALWQQLHQDSPIRTASH
ncbi:glycosyltransferase [Actinomyces urogenitalis]|uniref:glycosyltransferase n=1 Tax=Actinomyces urogenitalis TaxID=103621 RepID=UPI0031192CD1